MPLIIPNAETRLNDEETSRVREALVSRFAFVMTQGNAFSKLGPAKHMAVAQQLADEAVVVLLGLANDTTPGAAA